MLFKEVLSLCFSLLSGFTGCHYLFYFCFCLMVFSFLVCIYIYVFLLLFRRSCTGFLMELCEVGMCLMHTKRVTCSLNKKEISLPIGFSRILFYISSKFLKQIPGHQKDP